jgi:hypothetical protein
MLQTPGQPWKVRFETWKEKSEELDRTPGSTRDKRKMQAKLNKELIDLGKELAVTPLGQPVKQRRTKRRRIQGPDAERTPDAEEGTTDAEEGTTDAEEGTPEGTPDAEQKGLARKFNSIRAVEMLLRKVRKGLNELKQGSPSTSVDDHFNDLVEYRRRQQHEQDKDGQQLVSVLRKAGSALEKRAKTTAFVCRFISHLVEYLHRRRDEHPRTDDCDREKDRERLDSVPVVVCRIVNGLLKKKGAEALVVFNALVGKSVHAISRKTLC